MEKMQTKLPAKTRSDATGVRTMAVLPVPGN